MKNEFKLLHQSNLFLSKTKPAMLCHVFFITFSLLYKSNLPCMYKLKSINFPVSPSINIENLTHFHTYLNTAC